MFFLVFSIFPHKYRIPHPSYLKVGRRRRSSCNWSGRTQNISVSNGVTDECSMKGKIVSNEKKISVYDRLWKLWAMICKMIMDGVRDPEKVAEILQTIVDGLAGMKIYLRRLFETETMLVSTTDGTEKFGGSDLFGDRVYGLTLPDRIATPTPPMNAIIHDLVKNGKFAQFLGSLGENRPRWKNRGQVLGFCRDHKDKLSEKGATFFELEGGFVAIVDFGGRGRLRVDVVKFSRGYVWCAACQRRVVSPQQ